MSKPNRLWRELESGFSHTAVEEEWRFRLKEEYELVRPFLLVCKERALSYPHPNPYSLPYKVVVHDEDDIVGVDRETGETIPLTKEKLVVYELNRPALAKAIAKAFEIKQRKEVEIVSRNVMRVGHLDGVDAYLAFPNYNSSFHSIATHLIATSPSPFVLFTPTKDEVGLETESLLKNKNCAAVSLEVATRFLPKGRLGCIEGFTLPITIPIENRPKAKLKSEAQTLCAEALLILSSRTPEPTLAEIADELGISKYDFYKKRAYKPLLKAAIKAGVYQPEDSSRESIRKGHMTDHNSLTADNDDE